ncbi:MAG: DUF1127 domain-containing protein [Dongiaceae bacterium]
MSDEFTERRTAGIAAEPPDPLIKTAGKIDAAARRGILAAIDTLFVWLARYRQRRALDALGDHMLKDIGVSRADIDREASKRFWQE